MQVLISMCSVSTVASWSQNERNVEGVGGCGEVGSVKIDVLLPKYVLS